MRHQLPQGTTSADWVVVLPIKHAGTGKSRLKAPDGVDRGQLARAIAVDALDAVRACDAVAVRVVVTSDPVVAEGAAAAGDVVVGDDGTSLSAAVRAGLGAAAVRWPQRPVAVLLADLPALRPNELGAALVAAAAHRTAFVPDADGLGTVLLTARHGVLPRPAFGTGSAARHEALGALRLDLDLPTLRRDVDTAADLRQALDLGVGPATAALLGEAARRTSCPLH